MTWVQRSHTSLTLQKRFKKFFLKTYPIIVHSPYKIHYHVYQSLSDGFDPRYAGIMVFLVFVVSAFSEEIDL